MTNLYAEDAAPNPAEFPNTIKRRPTSTTARSDSMAESAVRASTSAASPPKPQLVASSGDSLAGDVDTCRICRGEGTPGEPLFYPCKCSGSIKYVHQDCLMEWLSHSQKKHCELCKTPFRFTKLYSPNMPKRLPFHVFTSHMAKYMLRNILVWLRAALVMSVWLGWLPYLMRSVWSFLFWVSDEGFGPAPPSGFEAGRDSTVTQLNLLIASQGLTSTTCPSSPLFFTTTTAALKKDIAQQIPNFFRTLGSLQDWNATSSNSFTSALVRMVFGGSDAASDSAFKVRLNATHVAKLAVPTDPPQYSTLLSEVGILKNLTKHPALNRILISVLEGQIITILVIVCFILIILVRDYVVQQQPEINMRAAFAAQENNAEVLLAADVVPGDALRDPPQEPHRDPPARIVIHPQPEFDDMERNDGGESIRDDDSTTAQDGMSDQFRIHGGLWPPADDGPAESQQRPIAGFKRRLSRRQPGNDQRTHEDAGSSQAVGEQGSSSDSARDTPPESLDESLTGQPDSTVNQYLRIYRQAAGDREKILRIIHDEGLDDRLAVWVRATQASTWSSHSDRRANESSNRNPPSDLEHQENSPVLHDPDNSVEAHSDQRALNDINLPSESQREPRESQDRKGKGKAVDRHTSEATATTDGHAPSHTRPTWENWGGIAENQWNVGQGTSHVPEDTPYLQSVPSRPRAISDGPQRHETINPLANNNWSFSDLPAGTDRVEDSTITDDAGPSSGPSPGWMSSQLNNVLDDHYDDVHSGDVQLDQPNIAEGNDDAEAGSWFGVDNHANAAIQEDPSNRPTEALGDGIQPAPAPPQILRFVDHVADFMWGGVENDDGDDVGAAAMELFIDDQDAPFMNANRDEDGDNDEDEVNGAEEDELDDELAADVVEAAVAAGIDPEAIDDAEDFDGVMELLGMRGPIAGLFQNAIFCAFLVSVTIFLGIFLPYNVGRVAVWILANPMRIVRIIFSFSRFVQDICILAVGWTSNFVFDFAAFLTKLLPFKQASQFFQSVSADAKLVTSESYNRLWDSIMSEFTLISSNEVRNFSAVSHEALITVKAHINLILSALGSVVAFVFGGDYASKWALARPVAVASVPKAIELLNGIFTGLTHPNSWMINLNLPEAASSIDSSLTYWGAKDRTLAILGGYLAISTTAGLYLGRGTPFSSGRAAREWEASVFDALNQASGVMKVILIISIEMLIFPLYCGLLLDFALLPLIESTTFRSRLLFTYNYPLTSIFVHWFVGTGYMFHFALFVSMCRKIMRKGVLYFIRDPDDPEFHPVRDVLERNVTTQLRKILFSAFVYGALVVVCLGGVVWSLSLTLPHVLPIHYSSNEPVLEFPIDLLFYNFLMPLAVKFFKPSDGLHAMYTWWFRRCARTLRLTWFLFGERRIDEEGRLQLGPHSINHRMPRYRRFFLEVNESNEVVPKTWADTFEGGKAKPVSQIQDTEMNRLNTAKSHLVGSGQLVPNGRFVRTPASDQVKIPKGQPVFLTVTEQDTRSNGELDEPDADLYSSRNYQFSYVPPWFRTRIFLFIMLIWIFAAVTGVGFTIVPLVFGRQMFKLLIPAHIRTNDIYAFSIGVYILGSLGYFIFHARPILTKMREWLSTSINTMLDRDVLYRAFAVVKQGVKLGYTYSMLLIVFPLLITLLVELYVLLPLHTWKYSQALNGAQHLQSDPSIQSLQFNRLKDGHTIRVIQAWTLGTLYMKLISRALVLRGGRPAHAVRAVLRRGWLDPDVRVLTRAFVVPVVLVSAILIFLPPYLAQGIITRGMMGSEAWSREKRVLVFRMAYPFVASCLVAGWILGGMMRVLDGWRARVRDEAYLMGERLHNFGGMVSAKGTGGTPGAMGDWRGGARL